MARNFETPHFEHFLRVVALIEAAARGIETWRLIVQVPQAPKDKVIEALSALEAAQAVAGHAIKELEELEIAGLLHSQAMRWQTEGTRLIEEVRALMDKLPPSKKPPQKKKRRTRKSKK